jgi:hypothetical protein
MKKLKTFVGLKSLNPPGYRPNPYRAIASGLSEELIIRTKVMYYVEYEDPAT